jgi:cellulose synthase (UDP-forming)
MITLGATRLSLKHLAVLPLAVILPMVITVPLAAREQWIFAGVVMIGAFAMKRWKGRKGALAIGLLAVLVSTRYMFWRTFQTLEFDTLAEMFLGAGLYLAEFYAWLILLLGFLQTAWPLNRPVIEIDLEPSEWPIVDIYIPTYNESLAIVRNTVFAAMDVDYPADRFRVFILDDGKRAEFRTFAREAGCGYITRDNNLHAKAGNLNAAMKKTDGALIAIFDCDHVPTRAFLQLTVGWFIKDPRLALMQTPHHMYSPDPVQRNLSNMKNMAGEGDLFYGAVQGGNDLWNAAFFCGSCAIIRREALEETNGFAGETVTEDAHTALKLQRTGWNTAYIGARLSAGLATERLVLHVGQRIRWARGMTQILRIDCPLFGRGLSWQQRLCYLNAMLHFQYPLPRIVFLTSPLAYLLFGQNIIHASAGLIFAYAAPHLFCSTLNSERVQGSDRRPFWGEIYETILAFHLVKPTVLTWLQPRKGKFNVTDKGELLDQTYFDWAIVRPHLICMGLIVAGILAGVVKRVFFAHIFNIQTDTLVLNMAWALFSLVILGAAVSVAREQRQARLDIRVEADLPITVHFASGHVVAGTTVDVSMGGAAITLPHDLPVRDRTVSCISMDMGDETVAIPVETIQTTGDIAHVRFQKLSMKAERHLVRAILGRADAWQPVAKPKPISGLRSLADIITVDALSLKRMLHLNRAERRVVKDRRQGESRRLAKAAALAGALALGSAMLLQPQPAYAATATAASPTSPAIATAPGGRASRLTFKNLRINSPIRLQGTRGEIGIPFGMRQDRVVSGAKLTLAMAWSPAMLDDLSQLVVILNGEVVATVPLRRARAAGDTIEVPINPALFLPGDNQLNLRLLGHYARDCEDPFHSSLWANVSNTRSWLDLTLQPASFAPDLRRLPAPFFDAGQDTPLNIPFVFAGQPRDGELEAAASVASWLGSLASYRGFAFRPLFGTIPTGDAIVFVDRAQTIGGIALNPRGPSARVIRNPNDPSGTLLLIMGRDDRELKQAAAAVAYGRGVFAGSEMSFDGVRIPTFARYDAPRWISTHRPVTLGSIMQGYELQGLGIPPGPLSARFRVAPDLDFWPRQAGRLHLDYRYPSASWLDKRASRLDVSMNGQYLETLPLAGSSWLSAMFGGGSASSANSKATVPLPPYALFGQNEITFDYNLIIADKKRCEGTLPENVRVAIGPNSTIDLTAASHSIDMPNLAAFAGAGFPFTVSPDLSETVVVLAPNASPTTLGTFLAIMGRFGDSTGAATSGVTVRSSFNSAVLKGRDVLVIGGLQLAGLSIFDNAPVRFENGQLRVSEREPLQYARALFGGTELDNPAEAEPLVYATRGFSGLVSFQSPYDSDRTVVALLADNAAALPLLVDGMSDPKIIQTIQGDLSVTDGDTMTSFKIGETYWLGDVPVWMRAAKWFSRHPVMMALFTLLLAALLAGPAYVYFRRKAALRLDGEKEAK